MSSPHPHRKRVGNGSKGQRLYDWLLIDPGADQHLLLVRRYDAWYRHITLSMLAAAFLAVTAHTEQLHDQKVAPPMATST